MNLFISMRVFVKVVDKGSLTAAAKALSLSPAMVGNHLQALEAHLGITLMHRTTRRQSLTDAGQQYYYRCVDILGMVEDTEALVQGNNNHLTGTLCLTAPITFGNTALIAGINAFHQIYPQLHVDLALSDRTINLIEDDIDIAIRIGELPDSSLISRKLCHYKMAICAAPTYLQRKGIPTKPKELTEHNCIHYSRTSNTPWVFNKQGKVSSIKVKGNLHVNHGQGLREAANAGMGIIKQPYVLVAEDIAKGKLVALFTDYELSAKEVHIVYLKNKHMPLKVRRLIDFLLAYFSTLENK